MSELDIEGNARKLIEGIKRGKRYFVLTINSLIVYEIFQKPEYAKAVKNVNYVVPDGIGVIKMIKLFKKKKLQRVPGIELMIKLCELAESEGLEVFLLGSKEEVVKKTAINLSEKFPLLKIVGTHHGFFTEDENDRIVMEINQTNAKLLFVAMGVPKQEMWISKNFESLDVSLAMGVGGSFDVIAEKIKRAPNWMQKAGLEWLYRIVREPRKRMKILPRLFKFIFYVFKYAFSHERGD
ncbi:glycosyl transferase [Kosmotoga pacifica]|uniref:Glycosyl transferase n=1 Tax=Kosmotoga pacifica TaxID=1330330 RepID=A0A0G2Z9D1_9BACT|nr:glycosyl transferase [Kosmotoga pacifica]